MKIKLVGNGLLDVELGNLSLTAARCGDHPWRALEHHLERERRRSKSALPLSRDHR